MQTDLTKVSRAVLTVISFEQLASHSDDLNKAIDATERLIVTDQSLPDLYQYTTIEKITALAIVKQVIAGVFCNTSVDFTTFGNLSRHDQNRWFARLKLALGGKE